MLNAQGAAPEGKLAGDPPRGSGLDGDGADHSASAERAVVIFRRDEEHLQLVAAINAEHALAIAGRDSAVAHAVRCGELLLEQRERSAPGEFRSWIETHCKFAQSTATRYMAAARHAATGVAVESLRGIFPSGRRKSDSAEPAPSATRAAAESAPVGATIVAAEIVETNADITIERALELFRARRASPLRNRLLKDYDAAAGTVKKLRRALERAELFERNAAAMIIAQVRT